LARLRAELNRWLAESNDQGRIPESPEVIAQQSGQGKKALEKKGQKRKKNEAPGKE
jgi:hypothetical protein